MIYKYHFNDETITIEINESDYDLLIDMDREEYNSNRKHSRRYPVSLENIIYEGDEFTDDTDLFTDLVRSHDETAVRNAIRSLLPRQQELIFKVFYCQRSFVSIADEEGVTEAAIRNRLKKIYAAMKKYLI